MSDITILLKAAGAGDNQAGERVIALLYDELRRLAASRLRRSGEMTLLDTTSLVHEAWLRFQRAGELDFADRGHFLAYAAKVMRSIVIDAVRSRQADRHGGQALHVTLNTAVGDSVATGEDEVLRIHEALEELASVDPRLGQVVEMRYFGGLSESEIAGCLGLTERTVQRDWQKARLFLADALK
jgi:RNA polymerase sigma factor (TIGR02999 family)